MTKFISLSLSLSLPLPLFLSFCLSVCLSLSSPCLSLSFSPPLLMLVFLPLSLHPLFFCFKGEREREDGERGRNTFVFLSSSPSLSFCSADSRDSVDVLFLFQCTFPIAERRAFGDSRALCLFLVHHAALAVTSALGPRCPSTLVTLLSL